MIWLLGLLVVIAAVYGLSQKLDVRLVLVVAGLALGILAGAPMSVVRVFLTTLSDEKFVVPICTAMGFAYVLRQTQCDQHLVHMLVRPLEAAHFLLVPGAVLVGCLVNIPVISQAGTIVSIGPVLVPLLRATKLPATTIGAALLLGCSIGGELLNPGAPELRTVAEALNISSQKCVAQVAPLMLVHVPVTVAVFWFLSRRRAVPAAETASERSAEATSEPADKQPEPPPFRVNPLKALVPLVPVTLLFVAGPPLNLFPIRQDWLVTDDPRRFESRLIGLAMLVGVALASAVSWRTARQSAASFFDGAGYAFSRIIGVIVTATCFGEGIKLIGVGDLIGSLVAQWPAVLVPVAALLPLAFAWLCGSGMATTQSLFKFFVEPSQVAGIDAVQVGALVSVAAAAGRTMSPVAAVTLLAAELSGTDPLVLIRRVAVPLLIGLTAAVTVVMLFRNP